MHSYEALCAAWTGESSFTLGRAALWPASGVAIEGDFSGIQRFVLRPVPGASGAARRLRARSFRVLALTQLVAAEVAERFKDTGGRLFYSAGGRFLVVAREGSDWEDRLTRLQADLDRYLLDEYRGELIFHLAAAPFGDSQIPVERLAQAMARRKQRPLKAALQSDDRWATDRFAVTSVNGHFRCPGCNMSATGAPGEEGLCSGCLTDRELGAALLRSQSFALAESRDGSIALFGQRYGLSSGGTVNVRAIAHAPLRNGELATFEQLASCAKGREYLGYLRIDADRIGEQFRSLNGDPLRIRGLSMLLDQAFSSGVADTLRSRFSDIYPVYGGGDDLFVVGPWDQVLDFAAAWRSEFSIITANRLTFSAGMALAKPRQHILTKSEEAEEALNQHAKVERDSIHALGSTIRWSDFDVLMGAAQRLAGLHHEGRIRSAMLQNILELHARWRAGDARWHSLLYYQIERNLKGIEMSEARRFMTDAFLSSGRVWEHADFAVRYAMLRSGREEKGD